MAWRIDYTGTARKQLHKLDKQTALRIIDFMDERHRHAGRPACHRQGVGRANARYVLGRYRVGDYRIICDSQDGALCILVVEVGNRREIYQ